MADNEEVIDEFPPEHQGPVEGLLWLGHLQDEFRLAGHTFVLRTLKVQEELQAARLTDEYKENIGQPTAFKWAHIALALVSVDYDSDFCPPLGPDADAYARARFHYVTQWFAPVGEFLFNCYTTLITRQGEAIRALEDLSSGSPTTSSPSADSLNGQEDSKETSTPSN